MSVRAILLDVEGTTTPIDFVTRALFPYAREHVAGFLEGHREDAGVRDDLARLRDEHAADVQAGHEPPAWSDGVGYVGWLIDRDRKSTGLKSLQGKLWEEGYREGALVGQVYPDVPPAFERWRSQGKTIAIFSSGSVLAQRLLFGRTPAGDLTGFLAAHFDTTTGAKSDPESYRRIAAALACAAPQVLFVSDVVTELEAARSAGMETALCARGNPIPPSSGHPVIRTFDELG